jgi:anti-sigma factor RsiW
MQCSDLERYLEAYLDLRLGRSRGAILRRHLVACPACRARVERLRQFEYELQRHFRALEVDSVWSGLEPDLVRSGLAEAPSLPFLATVDQLRALPPPTRKPGAPLPGSLRRLRGMDSGAQRGAGTAWSRWSRRFVGAVLISAAVGATASVGHYWLAGGWVASTVQAYIAYRDGDNHLDVRSGDVAEIEDYLAARMGFRVPLPPTPSGFVLVGARFDQVADIRTASIAYEHDGLPALLYVTPRGNADFGAPSGPEASSVDGISHLQWEVPDLDYSIVSSLAPRELLPFAEAD